ASVDNRAVVVYAVAVVVDSGGSVEWPRRSQLCQGAGGEVIREPVGERNNRAMTLIDHAWSAFLFAKPRDDALVRPNAVAVRFEGVGRLGQRVADRGIDTPVATVAETSLQPVVISDAEIHQH